MASGQQPHQEQVGDRPGDAERRRILRVHRQQQIRNRHKRIYREISTQLIDSYL